jgi:hypothetical protein
VYYGTNAGNPSNSKKVGNVTAYNLDQLPLSENVQYFICVSAYNASGESAPCAPVGYMPGDSTPPKPPFGLFASIPSGSTSGDTSSSGTLVSNLTVASGKSYQVRSGLDNGKNAYIDSTFSYKNVPDVIKGATYIETASSDNYKKHTEFVSFNANRNIVVYVAHDDHITEKPDWLKNFTDTGNNLSSDGEMSIYKKTFSAGRISLGGNGGSWQSNMYTIAIE